MPSKSQKQHNLMAAVANNPAFAKKTGIPKSVGEDYINADKGIKFKGGSSSRPDLQRVNKKNTRHGKMELFKEGGDTMATKMNPGFMAMMAKKKAGAKAEMPMKKGEAVKKMMGGGMAYAKGGSASARADGVAQRGKTKGKMLSKGGKAC